MAFLGPIDLSNVKVSREAIPEGYYPAIIIETDVKETKDGTGKYIYLKSEITEGQYKGTQVEDILNVINKSEKATNIGLASLKRLCEAINIEFQQDTSELENKFLKIKVAIKQAEPYTDKNGNEKMGFAKNEIKGYYPFGYSENQSTVPPVANGAPTPVVDQAEGPFKIRK